MTQSRIVTAIAAAVLAVAAFPAAAQAPASYKIGYVDTERVMRDSRVSKVVQKGLDDEFARRAQGRESANSLALAPGARVDF